MTHVEGWDGAAFDRWLTREPDEKNGWPEPDFDARYAVKDQPGVAFWLKGWKQRWEPVMTVFEDEDGNDYEAPASDGDGEWVPDEPCETVIAVMVGDDREHEVWIGDLTPLDDDDYCSVCGQTGCGHG